MSDEMAKRVRENELHMQMQCPACGEWLLLNSGYAGCMAIQHLAKHGLVDFNEVTAGRRPGRFTSSDICCCGKEFVIDRTTFRDDAFQIIRHLIETGDPAKHLEDFWLVEALDVAPE